MNLRDRIGASIRGLEIVNIDHIDTIVEAATGAIHEHTIMIMLRDHLALAETSPDGPDDDDTDTWEIDTTMSWYRIDASSDGVSLTACAGDGADTMPPDQAVALGTALLAAADRAERLKKARETP